MNQKIKTILNKYKESAESSLKYKREKAFIEKMNQDEVFEIFKCILDEFYSEEEGYPVIGNDPVMDHKEEDENESLWKLIPSNDIIMHIESCTTRRMMNLMETCIDIPHEIKFNEQDHSLHIDYHTHLDERKCDIIMDMIKTIKFEDNGDPVSSPIYHRICVIYPTRHENWSVRIKDYDSHYQLAADGSNINHIVLIFEKCGPISQIENL